MIDEKTAELFRAFANVCRDSSPLYELLSREIAGDDELLGLAGHVSAGQPVPNLLFAVVQFLLFQQDSPRHELAGWYRSLTTNPHPPGTAFPVFQQFCAEHAAAIVPLLKTRRVQTNEVRRVSYLYPALAAVRAQCDQPLALVEVGCSAGFLLNWFRYCCHYSHGMVWGNPAARVVVYCEVRGNIPPPLLDAHVSFAAGLDLHPVDVTDCLEADWLRSLLWPDQPERQQLFHAAVEEWRRHPHPTFAGNALTTLPEVIRYVEDNANGATLCVFHSHVLNQFSPDDRDEFHTLLAEQSQNGPLFQLSAEWIHTPGPELYLTRWDNGQPDRVHLANIDHHGRWLEWLVSD